MDSNLKGKWGISKDSPVMPVQVNNIKTEFRISNDTDDTPEMSGRHLGAELEVRITGPMRIKDEIFESDNPVECAGFSEGAVCQIKRSPIVIEEFPVNCNMKIKKELEESDREFDYKDVEIKYEEKFHLCQECGLVFSDANELVDHECEHPEDLNSDSDSGSSEADASTDRFECRFCSTLFLDRNSLWGHEKGCKDVPPAGETKSQEFDNVRQDASLVQCEKRYLCRICEKVCDKQKHFRKHYAEHLGLDVDKEGGVCVTNWRQGFVMVYHCQFCYEVFKELEPFLEHKRTHTDVLKPFKCKHCNRCFTDKKGRWQHERTHSDKRYECRHCGKACLSKRDVICHERIHTGEKPFECEICKKSFAMNAQLKRHQLVHEGKRLFHCQYCEKSFFEKRVLTTHVRTHTGERPYKCQYCEKTFTRSSGLRKHEEVHLGVQAFKCSYCNQTFSSRTNVVDHEMTHTGEKPERPALKCKFCHMAFPHRQALGNHERRHTGERPHKCEVCQKTFRQSSTLIGHMRIHTGEKPYRCRYCNKAFTHRSSLPVHERVCTHAGEKSSIVSCPD